MNNFANQLQQCLFILLGIFIPTSIGITNIIIGGLFFCWILEGDFKKKLDVIKSSKWMLFMFGLIALYGLGILWGEIHSNATWEFQKLALWLVFPLLATIKINQKTIKYAVTAFLITTFISALLAILINYNLINHLDSYFYFMAEVNPYSTSAFLKYNYHNILLAFSFAICLYLIFEKKTKHIKLLMLFIAVYALSIFTEAGRAGQVMFNVFAIFYIIYYTRKRILIRTALILLLFSFQIGIYHSTNLYKYRIDTISKVIKSNGANGEGGLEDIRYVFFRESLNKILEKPILGYGTGSFGEIFEREVTSGHDFKAFKHPHNQYLYVWFEIGVFGLILLVMIFYYQIRELFKKQDGIHKTLLPLTFLFLMLIDSYFFVFTVTITYIYFYTICNRYISE